MRILPKILFVQALCTSFLSNVNSKRKKKGEKALNVPEKNNMEKKTDIFCIEYGADGTFLDVTIDVLRQCLQVETGVIVIPATNARMDQLFTDPLVGTVKNIYITSEQDGKRCYNPNEEIVYKPGSTNRFVNSAIVCHSWNHMYHIQPDFLDFAMQLFTVMFCEPNEPAILQIGSKLGFNLLTLATTTPKKLVCLEANHKWIPSLAMKVSKHAPQVRLIASAFAYQPVMLIDDEIFNLSQFEDSISEHKDNPVMIHSSLSSSSHQEEEVKEKAIDVGTGMSRVTLQDLEQDQVAFSTIVFESSTCLQQALKDAAPRVLHHVKKLLFRITDKHQDPAKYFYIQQTLTMFRFVRVCEMNVREGNSVQFWTRL